jgi:hypothetical protein
MLPGKSPQTADGEKSRTPLRPRERKMLEGYEVFSPRNDTDDEGRPRAA